MAFDHTIKKSTTSKIIEIVLRDSSTGQGKTGLATGDMSGAYVREGGTHFSLSFSAGSAGDSYSSGKWAEVDSTNMPGVYQFHLPNALLATGADAVTVRFGATGVLDKIVRISLIDVDLRDADNAGLADVAAILVDTGTTIPALFPSNFDVLTITGTGHVTVGTNNDKTGYSISGTKTTLDALNDIAATDVVSGGAITTSSGAVSNVTLCATTTTNTDMVDISSLATTAALTQVDTVVDAIKVTTDKLDTALSLDGSVYQFTTNALENAPSGAGDSAATVYSYFTASNRQDTFKADVSSLSTFDATSDNVTVGTNNDKTGYSISGSKTTLDALTDISAADVNAEVDTALSDIGLDHLLSASVTGTDVANNSVVAKLVSSSGTADFDDYDNTTDSLQAIRDRGDNSWTTGTSLTAADVADAVLDEALSGHTTAGSLGKAVADIETDVNAIDANVDAVLDDTANSLPATLSTLTGKVDTIDTVVDAILVDTGTTLPASIATLSTLDAAGVRSAVGLATSNLDTQLSTIDSNVDAILVDTGTDIPASITALPDADAIADAVWDESLSGHNAGGSTGKALRQLKEGTITAESQTNDAAASTTTFITDLTESQDGYYHDKVIVFTSGNISGQARHIETYTGSTKSITVSKAFSAAPDDDSEFIILAGHEHSLQEISNQVWNETRSGNTSVGTFGYYLDARVSQAGGGGGASAADIWGALLRDYPTAGTFGARFQEADRYTNTTANIIYVNQGDAYDDTANNAIAFAVSKDYSGADSLTITVEHRVTGATILTHAVTYTDATTLKLFLTSSDTAFATLTTDADFGVHPYRVVADYAGEDQTAVRGVMTIRKS